MKSICENIKSIRNTIDLAKKGSQNVELIAVTKTFSSGDVIEALECGIKHIGESKIQEALPKFGELGSKLDQITKHFIGHLQSNKAKKAVENFDLIHSLDSLGLVKELNKHAANINKVQNCLIEVKVSKEESKTGVSPDEVAEFYKQCLEFPNILIKGLMVITPLIDNVEDSRVYFREVKSIFDELKSESFNILSMGMSGDYRQAIEEGANMVRVGTAIFGKR